MKSQPVRIAPLPREEWTDEARDVFAYWEGDAAREAGSRSNTMMVMANHPKLALPSLDFGKYVLVDSTMTPRQREIILLRVAWRYNSAYQWAHHVVAARKMGMTDAEFEAIQGKPASPVWTREEQAMIDAMDQMFDIGRVEDSTWAVLAETMDRHQLMDFLFSVGFFAMNAWAQSSMGVQLEPELEAFSTPAHEMKP